MTNKDNEDFENFGKCWTFNHAYVENYVIKVDILVISLENISVLHIETIISILNHKIPVVFLNLKNFDAHLTMQELRKLNFKMSYQIN